MVFREAWKIRAITWQVAITVAGMAVAIWLVYALRLILLLLALTVGGQMVASVIVDHYGLLGFQQHPVTLTRLVGIALLLLGIWLVAMR